MGSSGKNSFCASPLLIAPLPDREEESDAPSKTSNEDGESLNAGYLSTDSIRIAMTVHEMRSPLTSIQGYVDLLRSSTADKLNDEENSYLEIMQKNLLRLEGLVRNLLWNEESTQSRKPQRLDLARLVAESVDAHRPLARSKPVRMTLFLAEALPTALCDPGQARQLVDNLLANALKFTPAGGRIRVKLTRMETEPSLLLSVEDNGIGIPEVEQKRLFEPYFKGRRGASIEAPGLGLGLYIARVAAEAQGGRIWVRSSPGVGSCFQVALPLAPDEPG